MSCIHSLYQRENRGPGSGCPSEVAWRTHYCGRAEHTSWTRGQDNFCNTPFPPWKINDLKNTIPKPIYLPSFNSCSQTHASKTRGFLQHHLGQRLSSSFLDVFLLLTPPPTSLLLGIHLISMQWSPRKWRLRTGNANLTALLRLLSV